MNCRNLLEEVDKMVRSHCGPLVMSMCYEFRWALDYLGLWLWAVPVYWSDPGSWCYECRWCRTV